MSPVAHFIDGRSTESRSGALFTSENPATGEPLAEVSFGDAVDVDTAVQAAARAFDDRRWRGLAPAERARRLRRLARLIEEHGGELASLESRDCGKPIGDAESDIAAAIELLEFYSTLPESVRGTVYADADGYLTSTRREPYGVVGAIAPWNYPFVNAVLRTGAALAVGNSVVLKMAEQAPLSSARFGELAFDAGLPAGTLNVVHGDGPTTGAALVAHPLVPKITFCGSTQTGREVLRVASGLVKSCQLELGGKSATIVFEDADLDEAIPGAVFAALGNSGQVCTAGSRILVAEPIADEVRNRLVEAFATVRVGDPADRATQLGPLVSGEQRERVEGYIRAGIDEGASVAVGGGRPATEGCERGYYVEPTLFTDVRSPMRIAQEEVFGPVVAMLTFRDDDDAIDLANDTPYGLAATVWTTSLKRALRATDRLEAGIVWTNCPQHEVWHASYVGRGQSGQGEDLGDEVVRTFTRPKLSYMTAVGNQAPWA